MRRSRPVRDRWFWLVILLALTVRSYHIAYPPWDYHNWRQNITLMVARDYARHGFHVFDPQVSWIPGDRTAEPGRFTAEFPVQCIFTAALYRIFGEADAIARIVTIAFSLLGICALYAILDRRAGRTAARLSALLYALLPYHIFFGRVSMPDVPALGLSLTALDVLDRWTDDRSPAKLAGAAVLAALAILQKLTVIFVFLPVLYLFWAALGPKLWRRREVFLFGLMSAAPPFAWYTHAIRTAPQSAFTMERGLFLGQMGLMLQPRFAGDVTKALALEAFSPLGLVFAVCGLFWPVGGRAASIFRWWIAGATLLLASMPGVLPGNHYYLSLLLPGGAALGGLFLRSMLEKPALSQAVPILLLAFAVGAVSCALPFYDADRSPYHLGLLLGRLTGPGELVATESGGNPSVLYAAGRRGWLLFRELSVPRLEHLSQAGARYYADAFVADRGDHGAFFQEMDERFERLTADDSPWPIYALSPSRPTTPLRPLAVRKLLDFPASFELIWCSHRPPGRGVRMIAQVADAGGNVAYTARFPITRPEPAETTARRKVLVLPVTFPPGQYRLRVGWDSPESGPSLSPVAIEVPGPPQSGWISPE